MIDCFKLLNLPKHEDLSEYQIQKALQTQLDVLAKKELPDSLKKQLQERLELAYATVSDQQQRRDHIAELNTHAYLELITIPNTNVAVDSKLNPIKPVSSFKAIIIIAAIVLTTSLTLTAYFLTQSSKDKLAAATALFEDKNYYSALGIVHELCNSPEQSEASWLLKAQILKTLNKKNLYRNTLQQLLDKYPSTPSVSYDLAKLYLNELDILHAEKLLLEHLQSSDTIKDSAYFYLAEIYNFHLNDYDAAIENYINALNHGFEQSYMVHFGLGYALYHTKQYQRSKAELKEATQHRTNAADSFYYLGMIALNEDQTSEACDAFYQSYNFGFKPAEQQMLLNCLE